MYRKFIGDLDGMEVGVRRIGVRGIVMKDDLLLMLRTAKGDVKFPGGGIEGNETYEEALVREIREETGYVNVRVTMGDDFAGYIERKRDLFNQEKIFEMRSYYCFAEVLDEERVDVALDEYEADLDFRVEWISIRDAILANTYALLSDEPNEWVERELTILQALWQWECGGL